MVSYEQNLHHSAPNIHENFTPAHPTHPPPQLTKCPRHGALEVIPPSLAGKTPARTTVKDTKEIMKKRRERAICVDRISRIVFPSTFVLLNIMYWLAFSDIFISIREIQSLR